MITKDRDTLASENDILLEELQAYKSVNTATGFKPRTNMTRVGRQPLASQSLNVEPISTHALSTNKATVNDGKATTKTSEVEYKGGDMTIDELM